MHTHQGRWQWIPAEQPQPVQPQQDTRFIRSTGEWVLFLADCAAIAIIVLGMVANQIAVGWRW